MILCGEDFAYRNMTINLAVFDILKYLIENVNIYDVKLATPSEYFDTLLNENYEFPVFEGDFLPYITYDAEYQYSWTGFYTTRPYLKSRIVATQKLVRTAELLSSFINKKSFAGYGDDVATHHDAFTGTCRHEVFLDYIRRLDNDDFKSLASIGKSFFSITRPARYSTDLMIPYKILILFNPINRNVEKLISFVSEVEFIGIRDGNGEYFDSQVVPCNHSYEIYFKAAIKSLGFKVLFIQELVFHSDFSSHPSSVSYKKRMHNKVIGVEFENGLISTIFDKENPHFFNTEIIGYNTSKAGPYIIYPNVSIT